MEIKEFTTTYLELVKEENKNLVNIAFDEMLSGQYEEATGHFDKLYLQDSNDYMSYFFRAYCKSHCGKRGDVYADSQKLTSAFNLAISKALGISKNLDTEVYLMISMYKDAMDNLAYNAVEEVHVDNNGKTYKTNPTKSKIKNECNENLLASMKDNAETFKTLPKVKEYVINYLKIEFNASIKVSVGKCRKQADVLVLYTPEVAPELEEKINEQIAKDKRKLMIVGIAMGVVLLFSLIGGLLGGC